MELDQVLRLLKTLDLDVRRATSTFAVRRVTPDGRELQITIDVTVGADDVAPEHRCRVVAWRDDDPAMMITSASSATIAEALATMADWNNLDRPSAPRPTRMITFDED